MRFAIVPIHLPKVPAPATKKWGQVIRSAAPVTQNHLSKLEYLRHQNATPLTKSVPWPPNICDKHVSCTAPATRNVSLQILFKCPTLANVFCQCYKTMTFFSFLGRCRILCAYRAKPYPNLKKCSETAFDFEMCFAPQRRAAACTFWTSKLPEVLQAWCVLYILPSKCSSRHSGIHFFDISIPKSTPKLRCFVPFDLSLRHNGVQLFISHLARWLSTRRFSEPTFRPSGATNLRKKTLCFATLLPFLSRTCIFSLLPLSLRWSSFLFSSLLWLFPPLLFPLSMLSEVWLLNFLRLSIFLTIGICWEFS